jgi:hypothetical protein
MQVEEVVVVIQLQVAVLQVLEEAVKVEEAQPQLRPIMHQILVVVEEVLMGLVQPVNQV